MFKYNKKFMMIKIAIYFWSYLEVSVAWNQKFRHLSIICCRDQRYMKYKYEKKKTK